MLKPCLLVARCVLAPGYHVVELLVDLLPLRGESVHHVKLHFQLRLDLPELDLPYTLVVCLALESGVLDLVRHTVSLVVKHWVGIGSTPQDIANAA